jgi:hypothetical protein
MRVANGIDSVKKAATARIAGIACIAAVCIFAAVPVFAQDADQRSGVSHPSAAPITTDDAASSTPTPAAKPPAAVPLTAPTNPETVYGPYVPYQGPGISNQPAASVSVDKTFDPDANIVTAATAGRDERRLLKGPSEKSDEDAGIVTYVPSRPGEIPEGSLVKVRLREDLSTLTTKPGTKFTAEVSEPVMRNDQVVIPIGSMMEGRVTYVRGGKRIGGSAAIHLEPRSVTLPDGAQYVLRARAIDTSSWQNTKVDDEGTIMRSDHSKKTAAEISLAAGGGMAAGALMGGVPGAVIGAGVGAGVGTIVWLKEDHQAELPKNLGIVFSLTEPMSVTPASAAVSSARVAASGGN